MEDPYEGQKFTSFEVLKKYLEEYGKRNFVKFWIRSSHTINSLKSKVPKNLNRDLKYVCMKFACIFGGEKIRCRGSGIRKSTTYRNLGCPCMINAVVGEDGNHVKLDTVILEHNHSLCKSLYDSLKKTKKKCELSQTAIQKPCAEENGVIYKTEEIKNIHLLESEVKEEVHEIANYVLSNENIQNDDSEEKSEQPNSSPGDCLKNIQEIYGSNVKIIVINSDNVTENHSSNELIVQDGSNDDLANLIQDSGDNDFITSVQEKEICRLCLSSSNNLSPIFNDNLPLASTILAFKIMGCASIEVTSDDGLPSSICSTCEATLDIAYNFRIRCEKSDSILRKLQFSSGDWVNKLAKNTEVNDSVVENDNINFLPSVSLAMEGEDFPQETSNTMELSDEDEIFSQPKLKEESSMEQDSTLMESDFTCPLCNINYSSNSLLLKHMKEHSDNENFLLNCHICGTISGTVSDLRKHMATHLEEPDNNLTYQLNVCAVCELTFATEEELNVHEKLHLPSEGEAIVSEIPIPIEMKSSVTSNSYLCNVCGKILKTRERFQSHKNTHEGLRPHVCIKCGKGFADRKNMHQHIDVVHLRKAKHECPICQKKFYTRTKMKSHLTVHYGVKPFTCDVCNKTFRLKMNMIKHKKTHSNDRPHQCDKCSAAFIDKNMLKRHSYIHGGIRPYPCPICGHRFSVRFHLKKHLEKNKCHGNTQLSADEWMGISQTDTHLVDNEECVVVYETSSDNILQESVNGPLSMDLLNQYDQKAVVQCVTQV